MYRIHRIMATPFRSVKPKSALLDHFLIAKSGLHNARHPRLTDRRVSKGMANCKEALAVKGGDGKFPFETGDDGSVRIFVVGV